MMQLQIMHQNIQCFQTKIAELEVMLKESNDDTLLRSKNWQSINQLEITKLTGSHAVKRKDVIVYILVYILVYGCETCVMKRQTDTRLDVWQWKMLRRIFGGERGMETQDEQLAEAVIQFSRYHTTCMSSNGRMAESLKPKECCKKVHVQRNVEAGREEGE